MLSWAEKFLKNLPLAPLAPPPKLGRVPSSFAVGGAFVKSILPPFRPLRPRRDRIKDELDARSKPFLVLATVCLRLSVLSVRELMCKCIIAPMFLSRGDMNGPTMRKWGRAVQGQSKAATISSSTRCKASTLPVGMAPNMISSTPASTNWPIRSMT